MNNKAILLISPGFSKSIAQEMVKRIPPMSEETAKSFGKALEDYAETKNPVFKSDPIPYTNPYMELDMPKVYKEESLFSRKKFRKKNNRKHKKPRR